MAVLKYLSIGLACLCSVFGSGFANAQQVSKADYRAIVGMNSTSFSFKTAQTPASLQSATLGTAYPVKRIDYEVFGDSIGRLKFFLPPGTVAFNANLYYFLAPQEGRAVLRLNETPATPMSSITASNARGPWNEVVLQNLLQGKEVLYYSAGAPANSMVLSSPDNAIVPMANGGYVYGNFQYPGELLQRGLLQIFVKADCYEQWFNSASTKWDFSDNPDENATHTCDGSSGGTVTPLQDVLVSPASTIQVGTAVQELTLSPSPAAATLPACTVEGPAYVSITGNRVTLLPLASSLTSNASQTVVCGSIRKTITIIPSSNGVRVEKLPVATDANGNLVLNVKLIRPQSDLVGKTTTSYWIAARIPANGYFFTEDEWFFLTPRGWEQLILPNPALVAYEANQTAKQETTFSIPIGLTPGDLGYFNVELHFGYLDVGGAFQNKGAIWTKD